MTTNLLSALDVVNAACAKIGEEPLQSLDEETDAGQAAALLYTTVVDFNLGVYPFGFSKQLRQLSKADGVSPLGGYLLAYDMPAERIGDPLYCTDDVTDADRRFSKYAIIGSRIHTSADPLYCQIQFRPDPWQWSPTFRGMTITALSAEFAMSLGHDRATHDAKIVEAYGTPSEVFRGGQMGAAIRADSFTTPPRKRDTSNNPLENSWRR